MHPIKKRFLFLKNMKIEFSTKLTRSALYDYNVYHTYNSFSGLFGTGVGAIFLILFVSSLRPMYLIAGLIIIAYLPITLWLNVCQQVPKNEDKIKPFRYTLDDEGVTVAVGDDTENTLTVPWDGFRKAVSTKKSIILYTNKKSAFVFVRKDMGADVTDIIKMICTNISTKKNKIRF